jgi:hypothetical protein
MTYRNSNNSESPFSSIMGVLIVVGIIFGIYYISTLFFKLLYFLSPVLLLATLVIDYKVVVNFGKWVLNLFKKNPIMGIGATVLTLLAYPVVIAFLFGKALFKKQVKQAQKEYTKAREGELVDFEELESKPKKLELPELEKKQKGNDYEQLFED